jgi:competence protein ComEC
MLQPDAILPHGVANRGTKSAKPVDALTDFGPAVLAALGAIIGTGLYFSLPFEPSGGLVFTLFALGMAAAATNRFSPPGRKRLERTAGMIAIILLAASVFMLRAGAHTHAHHGRSPAIESGRAIAVEGWLEAVDRSGSGRQRLLIRLRDDADTLAPSGLAPSGMAPSGRQRVRVLGDPGAVGPGDAVTIRAVLATPRSAAVAGGYDFAFHAGFEDIVATGFAVAPAEPGPALAQDRLERRIARLRAGLSAHIRARMAPRPGGLAAALLTGDRAHVDPGDVEILRRSGLGHVLAISGMHMALLAGGVFFAVRLALSAATVWARRQDPAVPAAWIALVFALGYLVISGGAIPTQRAFIMTVTVLGAVILRRRALSLHTLALGVVAVLALQPQAVITPGFQMSFSAAAALIAAARVWQDRRDTSGARGLVGQVRLFLGGLGTTSLVAGTATAGFAAFHFHRIASFGLAGNLLVMPIFSLIVMPAGVLGFVLIPLGLDGLPFAIMEAGLSGMLQLAAMVADWPGAQRLVAAASGPVLALFATGFVLLLLLRGPWRMSGALVMGLALAIWSLTPQPNLFISETGLILARETSAIQDTETGGATQAGSGWVVSDRRRSRFAARVFLEARGEGGPAPTRWSANCDAMGCSTPLVGLRLTRLTGLDDWQTDCERSDLIVSDVAIPDWIEARCTAVVFDPDRLDRTGSQLMRISQGHIRSIRSARPEGQERPWRPL